MEKLVSVILAAGKGTRMKSVLTKVLHPIAGRPMLHYPVQAAREIGCEQIVVVVGHQREQVEQAVAGAEVSFVVQDRQLGSGHAVAVCEQVLQHFEGDVLILCGDVPFVRPDTLRRFVAEHARAAAAVSVLSVNLENPDGYGRIVRAEDGAFLAIVEHRDATPAQRGIHEINTGIYCCSGPFLFRALRQVGTDNDQGEYYLPDIVAIGREQGRTVQAIVTADRREVQGINDRVGLAQAERLMQHLIHERHMLGGVSLLQPESIYIEDQVVIASDVVLHPNTVLRGATVIGSGCVVEAGSVIMDATIGNNVHIGPVCVIDSGEVQNGVSIGPLAHVRSGDVPD